MSQKNLKRSVSEISSSTTTAAVPSSRSNSERGTSSSGGGGGGIDTHPYSRGSVIEVIYSGTNNVSGIGGGSSGMGNSIRTLEVEEDSDMDEDFDDIDVEEEMMKQETKELKPNEKDNHEKNKKDEKMNVTQSKQQQQQDESSKKTNGNTTGNKLDIRLADIIDRCLSDTPNHENPAYRYKYYIHYREHNRRMDEWITNPLRIVSPPSVGNAKVREMKKAKVKAAKEEEEKRLRERERLERKKYKNSNNLSPRNNMDSSNYQSVSPSGRTTSQRVSSRRAIAAITNSSGNHTSTSISGSNPTSSSGGNKKQTKAELRDGHGSVSPVDENEQLRLTRRQRRKSSRGGTEKQMDDNDPSSQQDKLLSSRTSSTTVITTLLPDDGDQENIKDKVLTVAARELDEHEGLDEASLREHEEVTKVKNVAEVQLGRYRMNAWYFSPIPKELFQSGVTVDVLYVCEFTLQFFSRREELLRFQAKTLPLNERHPPGNEIYRNGNLSMFEIDGFEERMYCQNLCYIAKLFLDHKTLYFDVDPFLFYVLCEVDDRGFHPVGYYSKEKYSDVGFNLACILTFPCHQRKGYGRFLIDFSYELSKKEEKVGSPEKPMSDLGQQAYKPYWTSTLVDFLLNQTDSASMSIMDISKKTSIMAEDIIFTLNVLGLLKYINGVYFIAAEKQLLQELAKKHRLKEPRVDPSKLHWSPFLSDIKRDKFSIHNKRPRTEEGDKK